MFLRQLLGASLQNTTLYNSLLRSAEAQTSALSFSVKNKQNFLFFISVFHSICVLGNRPNNAQ